MTNKKSKINISILSICLAIACLLTYCLTNYFNAKYASNPAIIRTIDASSNEIDYQSILDEFEDAKLETKGSITVFEGTKKISLNDFSELNNLSECDINTEEEISITYNFSYDSDSNIVTLSAETRNSENIIEIEEIQGVAFINEKGEIDAVLNIDGEGILLSELQNNGTIQNCGWFKKLLKTVVKVVAVAAPAVVAAGVGAISVGTTAAITTASLATAAVAAGVAVTAAITYDIIESQTGSLSFGDVYTIGEEVDDIATQSIVDNIYKTATIATLLSVGREYHIAFAVSSKFSENGKNYNIGDLYISSLTLSFAEAYAVLIKSGMVNLIGNLTSSNSIIEEVSKTTISCDMQNLIDLLTSYKSKGYFSNKVQGIYANNVEAAATLATVAGAWIKDTQNTLIGRGGQGGYNHFHNFSRTIHIWYGAKK